MRFLIALLFPAVAFATSLTDQVLSIPVGTWKPITTDVTMTSIDPEKVPALNNRFPSSAEYRGSSGFKALFIAWNSAAFAPAVGPCGSIVYMGGGHNNYYGNETVALDLCGSADAGPTWKLHTNPFVAPIAGQWPRPEGSWPDGSPSVPHYYDGIVVGDGKLMTFSSQVNYDSTRINNGFMLDLTTKQWTALGLNTGVNQGASAWDSKRHLAWILDARAASPDDGKFSSFDPATKTFVEKGKAPVGAYRLDGMMGYDPVNDLLVTTNFRDAVDQMWEYSPATNVWTKATMVGCPLLPGAEAMQWSAQRQAWILWADLAKNANVYEVKRSSGPTYTCTLLTDPSNTSFPISAASNGSYDKFQLVTVAGYEVLIGTLGIETGVWAFRLPLGPFADACNQPGVVICDRFDGALSGKIYPASSGLTTPEVSDGALNMEIVSNAGADTGYYRVRVPPTGEGQTLAFSYRKRLDAEAIKHQGSKDFIVWGPWTAPSCTTQQVVQSHQTASQVPYVYRSCGVRINDVLSGGDYRWQGGDFDCRYHDIKLGSLGKCHTKIADQWVRYYFEIRVGHFGQSDSRLVGYVKNDRWRKLYDFPLLLPSTAPLESIMLTGYMTDEPKFEHPVGRIAFDDLIVATRPLGLATL